MGLLIPLTRWSASRTRSWAQVKPTLWPTGISISADRSENVSREKNRDAARATCRALPGSSVL